MNKLIINTEAELLAAKNKDGDIIFNGGIEINIDIEYSFSVRNISCGNADIGGNAVIGGYADIGGNAVIGGYADIGGYAVIRGYADIGGYAVIRGNADIGGYAVIRGNAVIGGYAVIRGNADIGGYADIGGDFFKITSYLKVSCILGIKFKKLSCKAVVPASCSAWDREFWADRFGIDTSIGCWDEFVTRLAVVAPKLLKKKHWLPIEKLMLESSLGKYLPEEK